MVLSLRHFGRLVGATKVSEMALKLGLDPVRPLTVRNFILTFGLPLEPTNLRIRWSEGSVPVDHPPNSTNVPGGPDILDAELAWDDRGNGSQRAATAWTLHLSPSRFNDSDLNAPRAMFDSDFDTSYSWRVTPANEFGHGPPSSTFTFHTARKPAPPPPTPPPRPPPPIISITSSGSGEGSMFVVSGTGFSPNRDVRIRVVDDVLSERDFHQSSDGLGKLNARLGIPCVSGLGLHFSATDGRPDPSDLTGVLWSNTVNTSCP
jgi:hypothetical protein